MPERGRSRGRGRGRENYHMKSMQVLGGNFEKNPLEVPRSCFRGVI